MRIETLAVHAGYSPDPTTKSVAVPIYQTVAYEFESAQHGADLFNLAVPGQGRIFHHTLLVGCHHYGWIDVQSSSPGADVNHPFRQSNAGGWG